MDLTLSAAWDLWWSGHSIAGDSLYGIRVLWLGRVGKLLAFASGSTLIIDAIGWGRLVGFGRTIREDPGDLAWERAKSESGAGPAGPDAATPGPAPARGLLGLAAAVAPLLLALAAQAVSGTVFPWWVSALVLLVSGVVSYGILTGGYFRAVGRFLSAPGFKRTVTATAAVLFVLGFLMDFAAS